MPGRGKPKSRKRQNTVSVIEAENLSSMEKEPERLNILGSSTQRDIWILGDSLVRWAGRLFSQRQRPRFCNNISWDGTSELKLDGLHAKLKYGLIQGKDPKIIFVHVI
ncbi:uncharacterized protein LOC123541350 [Mercenaria mercenaria]|uniref:uncharacterized protein LOC123541350 n=1 Tax=Mercenaria mercenaria TaxID=6596 RepID=UPI00234F2459|nr:uncharacterized protein LOC123541350 [Mercenaria mercenaria]